MQHLPFRLSQWPDCPPLVFLLCADAEEALYVADLCRFYWPRRSVFYFPAWDTLPYDGHRVSAALVQQRLQMLAQWPWLEEGIFISTVAAVRQKLAPPRHLDAHGGFFHLGQSITPASLEQRWQAAGHRRVGIPREPGEYRIQAKEALLFPLNAPRPLRLRWQRGRLSELHFLDPQSHEASISSREILLTPPHELDLTALAQLQRRQRPACAWDYYLPLLFSESASLWDYLPPGCFWQASGGVATAWQQHEALCRERHLPGAPPPEALFYGWAEMETRRQALPPLPEPPAAVTPLHFSGDASTRQSQLEDLQQRYEVHWHQHGGSGADYSPLRHSFLYQNQAHISSWDWQPPREESASAAQHLLLSWDELQPGMPIIHRDWGVGRYEGLSQLDGQEWIKLRYADAQFLLLSPSEAECLLPYRGEAETAPLHALGSASWRKLREKVQREASDQAAELLALYAAREAAPPLILQADEDEKKRFAEAFPYALTADQERAIQAVEADLAAPRPMDRLLCGDVGFGKTEVALRAAFIAIQAGYQVALIAPTTLLAEQHEQQWQRRFQQWARLCALHRFKSASQQKSALAALAAGELDMVIGTHRLLQSDVQFKRLGLLIVDEEQRFGVKHKEQLKRLRHNVNLLTLSATPIPRTLNMALQGLRDLSLMQTPPQGRLPVRTAWSPWNEDLIREACLRELARAGQIYFLHNDVASMARMQDILQALLPELRIASAHGQMKERELEAIMRDFQEKRFDLLLSSTIIESGIDLPNANTIIIHRADRLGLGQLHQLRGRVGRSHRQAYAYLLTPEESQLQEAARLRLERFCQLESVGAGFLLASLDLEQRGAGAILGTAQSGQSHAVGLSYYLDALQHALRRLQQPGSASQLQFEWLDSPHFSPSIIPQPELRLDYYQRLARCSDAASLEKLWRQIEARHGRLEGENARLLRHHRLRLRAEALPIARIQAEKKGWRIEWTEPMPEQQAALIELLQREPQLYRLQPPNQFFIQGEDGDGQRLEAFLKALPT